MLEAARRTNALTEVRVVRVTPFRFGGPEAGETAKILRRALSKRLTKAAPGFSDTPDRCERPEEARSALEAMLLADGPALCEAVVDPFVPPMPARVKAKQALHR